MRRLLLLLLLSACGSDCVDRECPAGQRCVQHIVPGEGTSWTCE